jgi:hypothetical protein
MGDEGAVEAALEEEVGGSASACGSLLNNCCSTSGEVLDSICGLSLLSKKRGIGTSSSGWSVTEGEPNEVALVAPTAAGAAVVATSKLSVRFGDSGRPESVRV